MLARLLTRAEPQPRRRRARPRREDARASESAQTRADMAGVAAIGVAVFLGYVIYLGWDGGRFGTGAERGLAYAVGAGAIAIPLALAALGVALLLRPLLPPLRTAAAGAIALASGLLLALAAQTGGLAPSGERQGYFRPDFFADHGGALGEVLYWATTTLGGRLAAHVAAISLVAAGALLLSGQTASSLLAALGRTVRGARRQVDEFATAVRETGVADPDIVETEPAETERLYGPPEPVAEDVPPTRTLADELPDPGPANFDEVIRPDGDDFKVSRPQETGEDGAEAASAIETDDVTVSDEVDFQVPSRDLLERGKADRGPDAGDLEATGRSLLEALGHFGVDAKVVGTVVGPHVSRFELRLAPGTKVAKVAKLKDDLAYALASTDIRILAPIPGKQAVGVEVPNRRRRIVRLGDIYGGRPRGSSPLVAWLGKDIAGHEVWTDLQKMPHVLVAGTTGSGKSGAINAMLSSILLHASPNDVRLVLVDPKRVELNHYERLPHLLTPVVTSPRLAANALVNLIAEMESRYAIMGAARARQLSELNATRRRAGEAPLPHILCVIDELADLMMVAPAEVEDAVIRLAQKSRAVGIHLVLATQRPSTDIITGTIKVNVPARIAFSVSSQVDSRVILDQNGAEALLGQGDMLFRPAGTSKLQRIQGAFVSEAEIAKITSHWARQAEPEFANELLEAHDPPPIEGQEEEMSPDSDDLLDDVIRLVVESQSASVSMIQRRFRVGYTRAGRLIDMLERRGIISGYEGSKPRQVLVTAADLPRVLGGEGGDEAGVVAGAEAEAEPLPSGND